MKVAILRPKEHLEESAELLRKNGFEVVTVPFLKIVPNEDGIRKIPNLKKFDVVIVTSQTSAKILVERGFKHDNVIAIGKKTAEVLRTAGINPKTPSKFDSKTLYEEFKDRLIGLRVAIVRSDKGDPILLNLLAEVEEIVLYRIEFEWGDEQRKLIESLDFDAIVFSSRMMVRSFMELAEEMDRLDNVLEKLKNKVIVAIGPPTKRALEDYSISALMPEEYTFEGVLRLLMEIGER